MSEYLTISRLKSPIIRLSQPTKIDIPTFHRELGKCLIWLMENKSVAHLMNELSL